MAITEADLRQFIGSQQFYKHSLNCFVYTEGVQYLAEKAGAYWLLDAIGSYQRDPRITDDKELQYRQFWKLEVRENQSALLWCERDKDDEVWEELLTPQI